MDHHRQIRCHPTSPTPQVASQRYAIYNVFMNVPLGLARSLATKKLDLDDEDEDDDIDNNANNQGQVGPACDRVCLCLLYIR